MGKETITPWESVPITHPFMFNKVLMSDLDACKGVIETLLDIKASRVECVQDENTMEVDALLKGVRFDVYVSNSTQVFEVELQMANGGALPMRARYYQSLADFYTIDKEMSYSTLKESYTLFFCPFDLFGDGLPVYTFKNTCREYPEISLNDKTQKVFYNFNKYEMVSDEEKRRLLEFFSNGSPSSQLTSRLDAILHELQENQKLGQEYMKLEMMMKDQRDEGITIGKEQGKIEIAQNMLKDGLSSDLIIKYTGISEQQINALL